MIYGIALLNITYEHNQAQRVGLRNFLTRQAEDKVRFQEGVDFQVGDGSRIFDLRYIERMIYTSQLFGEHLLEGDTYLEWRTSYSISERDVPDFRRFRYDLDTTTNEYEFDATFSGSRREFYYLQEDIQDHGFDFHVPFNPFGITNPEPTQAEIDALKPAQRIQVGVAYDSDLRLVRQSLEKTVDELDWRAHKRESRVFLFIFITIIVTAAVIIFCRKRNTVFNLNKQLSHSSSYSEQEEDSSQGIPLTQVRYSKGHATNR